MNKATDFFWVTLMKWFNKNQRSYPWRFSDDPYHILIAEFLLQQTHVRKVESIYHLMLTTFPTIEKLAGSPESKVVDIITPIGLTYRAERLKKTAQTILTSYNGKVPVYYDELIKLSGVGDYIANAVLCYGYLQRTIPIDTNVIRLFCRYFGLTSDNPRPRTDKLLASRIREHFLPELQYKEANLAVLDFAGLICTANRPKCFECNLNDQCLYNNK
ncbi:hypothetical protein ACFOLF_13520 [Paenibacillus sepulcri]|uniref:Adenine DNA glycosylase n=1 Tax=Paenibacillus sepulcri TaxID=359917 RepID=A0ABS7BW43_9BACL|nr:hypothetical protein [Paenibacillus sepulcri]